MYIASNIADTFIFNKYPASAVLFSRYTNSFRKNQLSITIVTLLLSKNLSVNPIESWVSGIYSWNFLYCIRDTTIWLRSSTCTSDIRN